MQTIQEFLGKDIKDSLPCDIFNDTLDKIKTLSSVCDVKKKILVACEESQAVAKAFRTQGFEAYSCDIIPCSGGQPEWHIQGDVRLELIKPWDLVISFPHALL